MKLTSFRNFRQAELTLSDQVNIFHGDNGAGKTNLLESIFILCLGRSQRGAPDNTLINSESDFYRVEGRIDFDGAVQSAAVACQSGGRKKITVDEVPLRLSELYERSPAVAAGTQDREILQGPPSERRNFVDMYLSQLSRQYLADLSDYYRALNQKNAALKNETDPSPFNELLILLGSRVMLKRGEFLAEVAELTSEYYADISEGGRLGLKYAPSAVSTPETETIEAAAAAFSRKLDNYGEKERVLKTSLVGPHRDDVAFTINGYPARTHASQGELRTAATSLKLAAYRLLKERRQTCPVLLLDEVFAELDEHRSAQLVGLFGDLGQVFLTTAQTTPAVLAANGRKFHIKSGQICRKE